MIDNISNQNVVGIPEEFEGLGANLVYDPPYIPVQYPIK